MSSVFDVVEVLEVRGGSVHFEEDSFTLIESLICFKLDVVKFNRFYFFPTHPQVFFLIFIFNCKFIFIQKSMLENLRNLLKLTVDKFYEKCLGFMNNKIVYLD